jgi:hypothetical protein
MAQLDVQIQRNESDDADFLAVVRVSDGRQFKLGIAKSILDVWREQVGTLDVDEVAAQLAKDILDQEPSTGNLNEGFLVTLDNGYATPIAAEQNLRNSGVLPFLASHHDRATRHTS